jgi:hypothetical protein
LIETILKYLKRTEFVLPLLTSGLAFLLPGFPKEAFIPVAGYVLSRGFAKRGMNTVKAGIKTSEFWVTIATGAVLYLWPDFPKEGLSALTAYIAGRGWAKQVL